MWTRYRLEEHDESYSSLETRFSMLSVPSTTAYDHEPLLVFVVDGIAGPMVWNGPMWTGERDPSNSMIFVLPEAARKVYTRLEIEDIATSCYVVDTRSDQPSVVELWHDVTRPAARRPPLAFES